MVLPPSPGAGCGFSNADRDPALTVKVDLTKDFGPSLPGKTIIIGSTEGNVAIDGHREAKIGLTVYRKV